MSKDFKEVGGKKVGCFKEYNGETVYFTERDSDGFVNKYNGFGISANLLRKEIRKQAKEIVVRYTHDDGTQSLFHARPRTWLSQGTKDQLGNFEKQYFLSQVEFDKIRGKKVEVDRSPPTKYRSETQKDDKQKSVLEV